MLPVDNLIGVVGITVLVKPHLGGQPIRGASLGEQDLVSEWEGGTSPKEMVRNFCTAHMRASIDHTAQSLVNGHFANPSKGTSSRTTIDELLSSIPLEFYTSRGFCVVGPDVTAKPRTPETSHSGDLSAFPG
jgi:hypothetical protein